MDIIQKFLLLFSKIQNVGIIKIAILQKISAFCVQKDFLQKWIASVVRSKLKIWLADIHIYIQPSNILLVNVFLHHLTLSVYVREIGEGGDKKII